MAYGSFVLMRDLAFTINRGDSFILMGGSGCGKSTLLKWVNRMNDSIRYGSRIFADDMVRFDPERVIHERALDYHIKIHGEIAVAWVPYILDINQNFSHCGIDVFTLLRITSGWKIVNVSFSIEPDGCEDIEKAIKDGVF